MVKSERIEIDETIKDRLALEKERTGLGPHKLLRGRRNEHPAGLTASMIHGWKSGAIRTAKKAHLDCVLRTYAEWTPPPKRDVPQKITLTNEHRAFIQSEVERTGLGAVAILRHAPKPLPEGLNHQKVQRWISGQTTSAVEAHWNLVLRYYSTVATA